MAIEVRIPEYLRHLTDGRPVVVADGASVMALIDGLQARHPGLREQLLDDSGLRRYVNVYVNDTDIRYDAGLKTALVQGDVVTILPAARPSG